MSLADAPTTRAGAAPARGDGWNGRRGPFRPETLSATRKRLDPARLARGFRALDALAVTGGALWALGAFDVPTLLRAPVGSLVPVVAASLACLWVLRLAGSAPAATQQRLAPHIACAVLAVSAAVLVGKGMGMALPHTSPVARSSLEHWTLAVTAALLATRTLGWSLMARWRRQGRLTPNVIVVGATKGAEGLIRKALLTRDLAILGIFDDRAARGPRDIEGVPVLGTTSALLTHPMLPTIDRIIVTVPPSAEGRVRDLMQRLRVLPNAVTLLMDETVSGLSVDGRNADDSAAAKRGQDLVIAGLGLIVAAPLMALIALAIRLDSQGPVFFRQKRHGFNNETITVWKFRSMRVEAADTKAERQVQVGDDRVTRVGRIIRKLSLDELPQLFNVIAGEMSLVGPRPHAIGMKTQGEDSARIVAEYAWRHRMKPGLTGWAQVNGSVGAVDTPEAVRRRVALDIDYIGRQSFWLDLWIIAITIPALVSARGVVR